MDVVVELVEGLLDVRVLTDLRADRDQFAGCRLDEVSMLRNVHQVWISETGAGKREQRDWRNYDDTE